MKASRKRPAPWRRLDFGDGRSECEDAWDRAIFDRVLRQVLALEKGPVSQSAGA